MVLGSSRSPVVPAQLGVPQGSVLSHLLYLLYTAVYPLLGLLHQLYAVDVQAYIYICLKEAVAAASTIDSLSSRMASNQLLLNPSKCYLFGLMAAGDLRLLTFLSFCCFFLISPFLSQSKNYSGLQADLLSTCKFSCEELP